MLCNTVMQSHLCRWRFTQAKRGEPVSTDIGGAKREIQGGTIWLLLPYPSLTLPFNCQQVYFDREGLLPTTANNSPLLTSISIHLCGEPVYIIKGPTYGGICFVRFQRSITMCIIYFNHMFCLARLSIAVGWKVKITTNLSTTNTTIADVIVWTTDIKHKSQTGCRENQSGPIPGISAHKDFSFLVRQVDGLLLDEVLQNSDQVILLCIG